MATTSIRPTKKQRELLSYIESFIGEHGYSPSYREIMNGLQYTSVATVALHVNNLIRRGHLRKRDRSARSLEVVKESVNSEIDSSATTQAAGGEEAWLLGRVEHHFKQLEDAAEISQEALDHLYVLVGSLKVLGFHNEAKDFIPRIDAIQARANA
jgi:SOS-response transcriptional repressor LexA